MDNSFWFWTDCYWKVLQGRLNVWKKIKDILAVIGACISVVLFTILLFVLRRSKADKRGSKSADERDTRIQEVIESSENRIDRSKEGIERCEEHLQRAEDILRRAISRSRGEGESTDVPSDRGNDN